MNRPKTSTRATRRANPAEFAANRRQERLAALERANIKAGDAWMVNPRWDTTDPETKAARKAARFALRRFERADRQARRAQRAAR